MLEKDGFGEQENVTRVLLKLARLTSEMLTLNSMFYLLGLTCKVSS
jgi:hypothetical protein